MKSKETNPDRIEALEKASQEFNEKKESMEAKPGDRFVGDAEEFSGLQAKANEKLAMIENLEKQIPPGANADQAKASLEAERKTLFKQMDKISERYGDNAWQFAMDANNLGAAKAAFDSKKKRVDEIKAFEPKTDGGRKGKEADLDLRTEEMVTLSHSYESLKHSLKGNYNRQEGLRKGEFKQEMAKVTDAEIDAALDGWEQFNKLEEDVFKAGEAESGDNESDAEVMAQLDAMKGEASDEDIAEAKMALFEKELPKDKQEALKMDIDNLKTELFDLKSGLSEAEETLRKSGIDVDNIGNTKDAESMFKAMQEQTSFWGKLKRGAKYLMNSEARKAMQVYNEKTEAMDRKQDEIAMAELALKDPQKSADLASKRLMRNIIRNASSNKADKPRSLSV